MLNNPLPVLSPAQVRLKLALRACLMSILQAGGVWLIAHGSFWAGCTGFLISYQWAAGVRDVIDHRVRWARFSYGFGGAVGVLLILTITRWLG